MKRMDGLLQWDFAILDWIVQHMHSDFLDQIMPTITKLGDMGGLWLLLSILLLCIPKDRSKGVQSILGLLFSFLSCNIILKNLIARPRPFEFLSEIQLLIPAPHDFSFPSGHTSAAFAIATVLWVNHWKGRYVVLLLAILVAFSRLYLYVHFPSDVLGGMLTGIGSGLLAVCVEKFMRHKTTREN